MTHVIIIGDGPAGLSAALFLAKNNVQATVFGRDQTAMHWAYLYNYLGIPEISGSDFMQIAREQARSFGASLRDDQVSAIVPQEAGFLVTTEAGEQQAADFVIIAEGKAARLAKDLGLETWQRGIVADRTGRTSIPNLFVVGRALDTGRSQAIISAGQGAAAALEILSEVHSTDFRDFDEPPKE